MNDMDIKKLLEQMEKNSIRVNYDKQSDTELPVGCSKIGGKPDLPANFEWFYYEGKSYDDITQNRPLTFLAQINCEEVKKYDKDSLLPSKGILYFFYELATMTWGFDPKDKGSARVYYYTGEISKLKRTDFPADLSKEYIFPETPVTFSPEKELPDFEEFLEFHKDFEYNQWDKYNDEKNKIVDEYDGKTINKLLGYANLVQGGMLLNCEKTTHGIYTGDSVEIPDDKLREYEENCVKWQLLFQLDSFETDGFEMMWGDVGRIYFYINTDDLMKLNFDNCWLILQCY